jgi:hypothetical protein
MQAVFKYELDITELNKIKDFCNSADYFSIEQSIGWTEMFYKTKICYFCLIDESGIKSFSQISENFKFAHVIFGPVCCDKELMITSINEIINYYKRLHFYFLDIQMYYKSGYDTDYIEYALSRLHDIKYIFDSDNTKSSIEINLRDTVDEINSHIRKGHKSDIKKAIKMGVTVDKVNNIAELNSFTAVYSKMCKVRDIDDGDLSEKKISAIYNYLIHNNKGEILIVKDNAGIVLGGAILVFQGASVRFLKGTSDPDRRDLPILHLVLYEAILKAKADNFKYFDFWGYNHFVDENDQIYNINKFKKGFGGYYTFFAKKMNISLIPKGYYIYKSLLFVKNILKKSLK